MGKVGIPEYYCPVSVRTLPKVTESTFKYRVGISRVVVVVFSMITPCFFSKSHLVIKYLEEVGLSATPSIRFSLYLHRRNSLFNLS